MDDNLTMTQLLLYLLKGGGGGDVVGSMGPDAWMEWPITLSTTAAHSDVHAHPDGVRIRLMVELGGQAARGSDRWDAAAGANATWKTCTLILDGKPAAMVAPTT